MNNFYYQFIFFKNPTLFSDNITIFKIKVNKFKHISPLKSLNYLFKDCYLYYSIMIYFSAAHNFKKLILCFFLIDDYIIVTTKFKSYFIIFILKDIFYAAFTNQFSQAYKSSVMLFNTCKFSTFIIAFLIV